MYTAYYIVGTLMVLSVLYFIFIVPKMKKKFENQANEVKDNLKGNEETERSRLLGDSNALKIISDRVSGEKLIGIVNTMEKRDMGDLLKEGAINMGGKVLGKVTGIGVTAQHNMDVYFVALTDKNIHYFVCNEGTILDHMVFDRSNAKHLSIEKATLAANYTGGSSGSDNFTFDYDGKKQGFYIFEFFARFPSDTGTSMDIGMSNDKIIASELFSKPFYDAIK